MQFRRSHQQLQEKFDTRNQGGSIDSSLPYNWPFTTASPTYEKINKAWAEVNSCEILQINTPERLDVIATIGFQEFVIGLTETNILKKN